MAFDQKVTYKVNIDDADFQAKLSQLRASLDMTMGGTGFGGGMSPMGGGFGGMASMGAMGAMMAPSGFSRNSTDMMMSGMADFGAQVRPITYTPPAISMQPHFGMIALQQTTAQSAMGSMGIPGLAMQGALNFAAHPLSTQRDIVPPQISMSEYMSLSTRAFATRAGDAVSTAGLVGASTAAQLAVGGAAAFLGAGVIGSTLATLPVSALGSAVGDMMAQNRAVQTQLEAGSFRFITGGKDADTLTGRGFGRRARGEVADFIQSQELQDVRYGMPEMKQILEGGMQMDLFSGTRDVEDFKGKFKGLVESLKTVTSTLHTSLKDGIEAVRGMRDMGITEPGDVSRFAMKAETMGRMSGRTGMEMMAFAQTGAEIFRGTGVNMQLGAETNLQNVTMIRQMLNSGTISRETVAQAGGEAGMAQQMTASALAATQTGIGRGVLMAGYDPSTGGLRPDFAKGGMMGLLGKAANMTPQQIMSFQANEENVVSSMSPMQLQLFGMQTDLMQSRMVTDAISGERRGTPGYQKALEENFISAERRRGVPIDVIRANMGLMKTDPEELKKTQEAAVSSMSQQAAMEDFRNTHGWKVITNAVERTLVQPAQRVLTGIGMEVSQSFENLGVRLTGGTVTDTSGVTAGSVKRGAALIAASPGAGASAPFEREQKELDKLSGVTRLSQITTDQKKKADEFKLTDKQAMELESLADRERGGGSVSLSEARYTLFGSDLSLSADEKTQQLAIMDKVLKTSGLSGARKELDEKHGQGFVMKEKELASKAFNEAASMEKKLRASLHIEMGTGGLLGMLRGGTYSDEGAVADTMSIDQLKIVSKMASASSAEERQKATIELRGSGLAPEAVSRLQSFAETRTGEQAKELRSKVDDIDRLQAIGQQSKAEIQGGTAAPVGGAVGEITMENLKQMNIILTQNRESLKLLMEMQKEMNTLRGSR